MYERTEPEPSAAPEGPAPALPGAVDPVTTLLATRTMAGNRALARSLQRWPLDTPIPPPRSFAVWAQHTGIEGAGNTCPDVAFADGEQPFPARQVGFDYTSLDELLRTLRARCEPEMVMRLVISCHGNPGVLYLEDQREEHQLTAIRLEAAVAGNPTTREVARNFDDPPYARDPAYFRRKLEQLREIAGYLAPGGRVMLFGCNAGAGPDGSRLLRLLASPAVFGRPVVGFTRILQFHGRLRSSWTQSCTIPGALPTTYQSATGGPQTLDQQAEAARRGRTTLDRPATENDPLTRVAEPGGTVTSRSDEAGPPVVTALDETPAAQGWGVAVPAAPRPLESAAERRRAIDATGGFFGRPGRRRR